MVGKKDDPQMNKGDNSFNNKNTPGSNDDSSKNPMSDATPNEKGNNNSGQENNTPVEPQKAPRNALDAVNNATSNPAEETGSKGNKESKGSNATKNIQNAGSAIKDPGKTASKVVGDKLKNTAKDAGQNAAPESVQKGIELGQKAADAAMKTKSAILTAKSGISLFAATVADPIFWIIVAVILVLVILLITILATVQVIGRTENADGCGVAGDSNSEGVPAKDSGNWLDNATSAANWMMSTKFKFLGDKPMSLNQAAGIIGNWSQESNVNPKIVQVGSGLSVDMSNSALAGVSGGGKAVGLAQWDGARRTALAKFADKQGKHWTDINVQLEYLKTELEGYEGSGLVAGGFNDKSKTAKELVLIFEEKFERAGKPNMEGRYKGAEEFLKNFDGNGGYTEDTGGSCLNDAGGDVDASDLVKLAISLSYPTSAESKVSGGDSWGKNKAKPEYKDAKKEAMKVGGKDGMTDLYASCDRFVATVIKLTTDKDIPWGSTAEQGKYLKNSSKWKQYTKKSQAKAGDIWITRSRGHVILYLGDVKGRDTIAHASYLSRVAALGDASYLSESLVDTGGRSYYGYTFVG